jgi:hypothetical protein
MDIKDFYPNTPMAWYKYMHLKLFIMPEDVVKHYHLLNIASPDGPIYCGICQGMYGLPQAGIIAQELLQNGSKSMATPKAKLPPYCGNKRLSQHHSHLSSMILE